MDNPEIFECDLLGDSEKHSLASVTATRRRWKLSQLDCTNAVAIWWLLLQYCNPYIEPAVIADAINYKNVFQPQKYSKRYMKQGLLYHLPELQAL